MHKAILCEVCKCTLVEKGVDSGHKSLGMKVLVDFDVRETVVFLGIWRHLLVNHSSVPVFIKRLRVGVADLGSVWLIPIMMNNMKMSRGTPDPRSEQRDV